MSDKEKLEEIKKVVESYFKFVKENTKEGDEDLVIEVLQEIDSILQDCK